MLVPALFLAACTVGSTDPVVGGDDGPGDPTDGQISGPITADQTWDTTMEIIGEATIEAGVTVTIMPGAEITARNGVTLRVHGTLEALGSAEAPISMLPADGALTWAGIVVESGGAAQLSYVEGTDVATLMYCHAGAAQCDMDHVEFTGISQAIIAEGPAVVERSRFVDIANGGLTVRGAGDLTVRDSYVLTSQGDLIVANGGTLTIEYSEIGDTQGSYDHCNFHFNAGTISVTRSNIIEGVFGMMIGGTSGAVFNYNNWMGNDTDVSEVGTNTAVNMQHNYWANGAPVLGAAYDVSLAETAQITDAGPRP